MTIEVPLGGLHRQLGARMVPFAGYLMPLQYSSIREEHMAVREKAGIFDVSHMGEFLVRGQAAGDFLQELVTNDVSKLEPGRALYTVMCREDGGIIDDLLVYRRDGDYMCVVNAARHDADLAWMEGRRPPGVSIVDVSAETALLAIQGPRALQLLQPLCGRLDLAEIRYYHHRRGEVAGVPATVSRTGYTGEDGFELYCDADRAERLWQAISEAGSTLGLRPAGLGARDTLRLEAGFRLYGQDMDEDTDPLCAGLGWVVRLKKPSFTGRDALVRISENPTRRFVGLKLGQREIARHGHPIFAGQDQVGTVTSGGFSFCLGTGIAMGYAAATALEVGGAARVRLRQEPEQWAQAEVVPLPFYRRPEA